MSETYPPEGEPSSGAQSPMASGLVEPQPEMPEPPRKPTLQWGFALLGFVATGVLSLGITFGASVVGSSIASDLALNLLGPIALLLELAVFVGMLIAWIVGRSKGNNRLRSFGIGGLVMFLAAMLFSLLAVGACFVSLGTGGGLFGN